MDSFRKGRWSPERSNTCSESWGFQLPSSRVGEEAGHWIPTCGQWCNSVLPAKWNPHKNCRERSSENPPGLWTLWCSGVVSADSMGRGLRSFALLPRPQPTCILYNKMAIISMVLSWVLWVTLVNLRTWGVCENPPEFIASWSKMWVAWGPTYRLASEVRTVFSGS